MLSLDQVEKVCGAPAWVWRELDTGGLSVVLKTGQKYQYSPEEVKAKLGTPPGAPRVVTDPKATQLDPVTKLVQAPAAEAPGAVTNPPRSPQPRKVTPAGAPRVRGK
jgi:hypothetical protein